MLWYGAWHLFVVVCVCVVCVYKEPVDVHGLRTA